MKIFPAEMHYLIDKMTGLAGEAFGVIKPKDTSELVEALKYAKEHQLNIIVVGANTGLSGGTLPRKRDLIIDLSGWKTILDFDEATRTLSVEAGVTLNQIYDFVEQKGYFYPPDPGAKDATIGGNIATNAGGMRAVKYGVTRDYVKALEVVLIDGTIVTLGSLNQKDSSNYDLKDLLIGSEGTLGIITKAWLKVVEKPAESSSLIASFSEITTAINSVSRILNAGVLPASIEFFENNGLKFAEEYNQRTLSIPDDAAYLLLTLDGDKEDILQAAGAVEEVLSNATSLSRLSSAEATAAWRLRDDIAAAVQAKTIAEPVDIVVPISQISQTLAFLKQKASELKLEIVTFGHAGDGNIHALILRGALSDVHWEQLIVQYLDEMYQFINQIGGLASAEHGIGLMKRPYYLKYLDDNLHQLYQRIKVAFDPEGRLNPGKKI
ncbi:MAG: FAD-binding oxidoreductase [Streptococcaceae bacterium]|jgi:glycolate oxidase|nr:FAD-binding oxidoreductase [Streptococcaceae bacterium]